MKKLVLFVFAWFSLMVSGAGLAQVQPEAQALIDKALVAHGGRAAIEGIKTMTRLELGRYIASDGKWYSVGWREVMDFAGRRYRDESISLGAVYQLDQETDAGAVTWAWDEGQKTSEKNTFAKELEFQSFRALIAPMRSATMLGSRTIFGVTGQAVTFTLQNGVDSFSYLFAPDGTILARARDTDFFPTGTSELFGDDRDVGGVRVFFSTKTIKNGELVADYRAVEVQVNSVLSDDLFRLPPPELPPGRIGVGIDLLPGIGFKVVDVTADSPAAKAGVLAGDVILEVDGTSVVDWNDLQPNIIRGELGTVVKLTLKRGDQVLKFNITRGK